MGVMSVRFLRQAALAPCSAFPIALLDSVANAQPPRQRESIQNRFEWRDLSRSE